MRGQIAGTGVFRAAHHGFVRKHDVAVHFPGHGGCQAKRWIESAGRDVRPGTLPISALCWNLYPAGRGDEDEENFLKEKEGNMSEECRTTESCVTAHKSDCEGECNFHEKLLALADEAWMELLKDKIKAEIEKSDGQHMDNIAKLVADANCARWGNMIQAKVKCNEFKESLRALMTGGCTK